MRNLPILILAITLLLSCKEKSKKPDIVIDFEDLVTDTIFLQKDTLTRGIGSELRYFKRGENEFLITFLQHRLIEFTYPKGRISRDQFFEEEGPDGIGSFISGSFVEDSTIWFLSNNTLIEADHFGKVHKRIELPEADQTRLSTNYTTLQGNRMHRSGDRLIIADVPLVLNQKNLEYENWVLKFNPDNSDLEYLKFKYPDYYKKFLDDPHLDPYKSTFTPNGIELISLPASDSLIIISNSEIKKVFAAVKDHMEFLPGTTTTQGEWIQFNPNPNSSLYSWVDFDPNSEHYIRLGIITPDTKENRDQGKRPIYKLVVLDRNFEKLAEVKLPFFSIGFSTPHGYYFNIGYPKSEDEVGYVRLDFSKINR